MRVVLCGNDIQVNIMSSRLKKSVTDYECISFLDNGPKVINFTRSNKDTDDIFFVAADSAQKDNMLKCGIPDEKITEFWRFEKTTYLNPIANLMSEEDVDGLIFGMSHSQCAIDTKKLTGHYYKVAAPSLDLFFQLGFLNKILDNQMVDKRRVHNVIVELPYYIFNYDLSRFGEFILTKLKYFDVLGNYHHYSDEDCIRKWKNFMSIFDEGISKNENNNALRRLLGFKKILKYPLRAYRISSLHDKVWERVFDDTIRENAMYFNMFINKLRISFENANIFILIMPFNPIFRITHRESINKMKKIFYEIVEKQQLKIIDEFEYYSRSKYFDDHCHLNQVGGHLYTEHLNKVIKDLESN